MTIHTKHTWQAEQQAFPRDADYHVAKGGLFDLTEAVQEILGDEPQLGAVFMYLFRRFGYPKFGWDADKQLVQYFITTPMDGVMLVVEPDVTGGGTFRYSLRKDINQACEVEDRTPYEGWINRFETWAKKEHGIEIIWLFDQDNDKLNRMWQVWVADKQERDFASETDAHNAFFDDQDIIKRKYLEMYREVGDPFVLPPLVKDRSDDSIMKQVNTALCAAIKDLLRPVYVRDMIISIKGVVSWSEMVECAATSGCGVGDKLDKDC